MTPRPIVGISMGDPAGIGPEILVKALSQKRVYKLCRPVVTGCAQVLVAAAKIVGAEIGINPIQDVEEAHFRYGCIDVLEVGELPRDKWQYGHLSAACGEVAFEAVRRLVELAMAGKVQATVTCPINKEAINLAGFEYAGHTEIFAHYTGTRDYAMMLIDGQLRVSHVSTHVSLRQACELVRRERVLKVIQLTEEALRRFGLRQPRLAVCGLNPHCGEGGLFGLEELEEIRPAVEKAREDLGLLVMGPLPADTVFPKALGGHYDAVVAMYHDQGHIPVKLHGFSWDPGQGQARVSGVNITLGLPIVRTSVDHGTAFDKAGTGTASPDSLLAAIECAVRLVRPTEQET